EWRREGSDPGDLLGDNTSPNQLLGGSGPVDLIYTLTADDTPGLPALGGPSQLVFGLGGNGVVAPIGNGQTVHFTDGTQDVTPEDVATLSLFQQNDPGNVLWQFGRYSSIKIRFEDGRTTMACGESLTAIATPRPAVVPGV